VGDKVVEILSVVLRGCGGRKRDAAIVRPSKLDRCLEMKISDVLDLAHLPSGDHGESCIPLLDLKLSRLRICETISTKICNKLSF
jgi:hypothetical protein